MSDTGARDLKIIVAERATGLRGELLYLSHALHADPEIRWQEHRSAELLAGALEGFGFTVERGAGGLETSFVATVGSGSRKIAFMAEYDALEGLGHACGHNIISAAAVGAGAALAPLADALGATVQVIGTPAEEGGGGKIHLIDAGIFDDVEIAMMVHPGPTDSVYARPFAVAHCDVAFEGFATHAAAYPSLGRNAADAFTIAQVAIGLLRQQLPSSVRVHGIVREAGMAPNAIPGSARGSWYVRASSLKELETTFQKVRRCFEAGALATGCELAMVETSPRYSEFRNDEPLLRAFAANAAARGLDLDLTEERAGGMNTASTDMGNVSQRLRAIHPYLSIDSLPAVNHQAAFADASVMPRADRTVIDGAVLLAQTAVDALFGEG
jgi:amidohydrolase